MRVLTRCVGGALVAMLLATALAACAGVSGSSGSRHAGAVAGLNQRVGDEFRRVVMDSGDTLPETITISR